MFILSGHSLPFLAGRAEEGVYAQSAIRADFISLIGDHSDAASSQKQLAALHLMQIVAATCCSHVSLSPRPVQQTGAAAASFEPDEIRGHTAQTEPKKGATLARV